MLNKVSLENFSKGSIDLKKVKNLVTGNKSGIIISKWYEKGKHNEK